MPKSNQSISTALTLGWDTTSTQVFCEKSLLWFLCNPADKPTNNQTNNWTDDKNILLSGGNYRFHIWGNVCTQLNKIYPKVKLFLDVLMQKCYIFNWDIASKVLIPQWSGTSIQLHSTTDPQLIWCLDVQMSSLLFFTGSYKKLCEERRPPHERSESQTLFKVCGGRSSTSKVSSSTKTSVPAVVSQRSRGNAESTPGCCSKCLRVIGEKKRKKKDNSRVFSSLFLLQWRHICDVGTVRWS